MELIAREAPDYEFLDAGNECRLERFGPHVFNRPSPVALWRPEQPDAQGANLHAALARRIDHVPHRAPRH